MCSSAVLERGQIKTETHVGAATLPLVCTWLQHSSAYYGPCCACCCQVAPQQGCLSSTAWVFLQHSMDVLPARFSSTAWMFLQHVPWMLLLHRTVCLDKLEYAGVHHCAELSSLVGELSGASCCSFTAHGQQLLQDFHHHRHANLSAPGYCGLTILPRGF
jgi:hypothetical protein